jgi:hypothetical protein
MFAVITVPTIVTMIFMVTMQAATFPFAQGFEFFKIKHRQVYWL